MTRYIVVVLCLILCEGCFNIETANDINQAMISFDASHFSDVVAEWGPPAHTMNDGKGGQIMTWTKSYTIQIPGRADTQTYGLTQSEHMVYTEPEHLTFDDNRTFWIDPNGIIYDWAWQSGQVKASKRNPKIRRR